MLIVLFIKTDLNILFLIAKSKIKIHVGKQYNENIYTKYGSYCGMVLKDIITGNIIVLDIFTIFIICLSL
jgi:hypothetical protein